VADNVVINAGSGGPTIRTEDVGAGVQMPITKIHNGANDADGGPVTSANPLDVRVGDGTSTAVVKAASTAAVASDTALVVAVSPNNGLALDATLTGGTQKAIARGAAKGATSALDVTATIIDADHNALDVIVNSSVTAVQGTGAGVGSAWFVKLTDGTTTAPIKAGSTAAVAGDASQVVALHPSSPVPLPTLTKSTQGATGITIQPLRDAGRVSKVLQVVAQAGVTTEALINLVMLSDLSAAGGATSYTVTAGKRFRIQSFNVTWRNNTSGVGSVTCRLRAIPSGTLLVSSPVLATVTATTGAATGSGFTKNVTFPDGIELPAGAVLGISQIALGADVGFDVQLVGFEY